MNISFYVRLHEWLALHYEPTYLRSTTTNYYQLLIKLPISAFSLRMNKWNKLVWRLYETTICYLLLRFETNQHVSYGAVVVAKLVERSLPTPQVCKSNSVINNILHITCFTVNCWNVENKKERPGMPIFI